MKRFSKMLALGLAAALVFGMTAQAESVNGGNSDAASEAMKDAATVPPSTIVIDGEEVTVEFKTEALDVATFEEVKTTAASSTAVNDVQGRIKAADQNVTFVGEPRPVAAFDLVKPEGLSDEQIAKGVTVPFKLEGGVKENVRYAVIHFLAAGGFEVLPATVKDDMIHATFTSFSPVVIVEQEVKVETVSDDDNNSSDDQSESSPATAPKTGETVPVAGVMALILAAGAAFCAKKARYNR